MKITGAKAQVNLDNFNEENIITCEGGAPIKTEPNTWYRIMEKGEGSELPLEKNYWFKSPSGDEQITLVDGDSIYKPSPERFCKTSASLSAEEGTIDVGDDCDPGAFILDGIPNVSGSLAGLFRYDDATQEFDNVTSDALNKFFDIVEDDGKGLYELKSRENKQAQMMICLNSEAKVGQVENWLIIPVIISSASVNLGNTDAQNKDLSWSKGEGAAVVYKRLKTE